MWSSETSTTALRTLGPTEVPWMFADHVFHHRGYTPNRVLCRKECFLVYSCVIACVLLQGLHPESCSVCCVQLCYCTCSTTGTTSRIVFCVLCAAVLLHVFYYRGYIPNRVLCRKECFLVYSCVIARVPPQRLHPESCSVCCVQLCYCTCSTTEATSRIVFCGVKSVSWCTAVLLHVFYYRGYIPNRVLWRKECFLVYSSVIVDALRRL
jgi:hypothetical protein